MFPAWYSDGGYWAWVDEHYGPICQTDAASKRHPAESQMSEGQKPAFQITAKHAKTKEKVSLFVGWQPRGDFPGFDISVAKDKERGQPKVTVTLEYPDGSEETVVLDPANKASTHYVTLYDNRESGF